MITAGTIFNYCCIIVDSLASWAGCRSPPLRHSLYLKTDLMFKWFILSIFKKQLHIMFFSHLNLSCYWAVQQYPPLMRTSFLLHNCSSDFDSVSLIAEILPLGFSDNPTNLPEIAFWRGTKFSSKMFIWWSSRMRMCPFFKTKIFGNWNVVPLVISGCVTQLRKLNVLAL